MNNPNIAVYISEIEKYRKLNDDSFEFAKNLNVDNLEKTNEELSKEIQNYDGAIENLNQLLTELNEKKLELKDEIEEIKSSITSIKSEISELQDESSSLYSSLSTADKEDRSNIKSQICQCNCEISNKQQELRELQNTLSDKKEELNRVENKISRSTELNNKSRENVEQLHNNQSLLRTKIDELNQTLNNFLKKSETAINYLQNSIYRVQDYLNINFITKKEITCNLKSLDNFSYDGLKSRRIKSDREIEAKIESIYGIKAREFIDNTNLNTKQCFESILNGLTQNKTELFFDTLNQIKKIAPDKYEKAIQYISAKGNYATEGIYDLRRMISNGNISEKALSDSVIKMTSSIYSSKLKEKVENLRNLQSIKLSQYKEDRIWKDSENLRSIVENETGKSFENGFQEFFIRLAKNNNQRQIEKIWLASNEIYRDITRENDKSAKDLIKEGIRPGGKHEWLMCENFGQFLFNTKWRKDGAFLVMLMTELVQDTNDVFMDNVQIWDNNKGDFISKEKWGHNDECSRLSEYNTFGKEIRPNSLIHNTIRQCIRKSDSAAELLVNIDKSVKSNFSEYTYQKFSEKLKECLA